MPSAAAAPPSEAPGSAGADAWAAALGELDPVPEEHLEALLSASAAARGQGFFRARRCAG